MKAAPTAITGQYAKTFPPLVLANEALPFRMIGIA